MNELELHWDRARVTLDGGVDVDFLGFAIDGQTLRDWLRWTEGAATAALLDQRVTYLGRCFPARVIRSALAQLTCREPAELPDGRVPLYVCPCGDPFCGSLCARVHRVGGAVTWDEFGGVEGRFEAMPTLRFRWTAYKASLAVARSLV